MSSDENQNIIRVGPAGWHYKDWYGNVYPKVPPERFVELAYIATYFDTAEINSTFYRPTTPQIAAGWVNKVKHNSRFMFTAKLWQRFTHQRTIYDNRDIQQVCFGMDILQNANLLGAVLIQFPWSFKCEDDNKRWLAKLINAFHMYPLVVEVRHSSWDKIEFYNYLNDQNVGVAAIDQPVIGQSISLKPIQTGSVGYIRMHGRNYDAWFSQKQSHTHNNALRYDYFYSNQEISEIASTVRKVSDGCSETYVVQNNHPNGQAVANAAQLMAELGEQSLQLPVSLVQAFPELAKFTMPF